MKELMEKAYLEVVTSQPELLFPASPLEGVSRFGNIDKEYEAFCPLHSKKCLT